MKLESLIKAHPSQKARQRCVKKFLYYFKKGFGDDTYIAWERQYKLDAHLQFQAELDQESYSRMLRNKEFEKIALIAVRIESKTNLLFSFEKMALRDAVKSAQGAEAFARGLFDYVYGPGTLKERFEKFVHVVSELPRKQTRVLTWPLVTVFGFIANPQEHIFLKPRVTQVGAEKFNFDFIYQSKPNWSTYKSLLEFASEVKKETKNLHPRDNIDLQSFIWVMGSDEYPD